MHAKDFKTSGMAMWSFPDCGCAINMQVSKKSCLQKLALYPTTLTLSKIHLVVVFMDIARDLGVIVKHGNSLFSVIQVFNDPSVCP